MIYDCFTFFNELDLLEIRLQELFDVVDIFVIVEADITFSGNKKELFFNQNKQRFEKYFSKIKHIVVSDFLETTDPWEREAFQRNAISRGLEDLSNSDYVMISDVDEIPRASTVRSVLLQIVSPVVFEQVLSYYHLNNMGKKWFGTVIVRGDHFSSPQSLRDQRNTLSQRIPNGGWHFSWIGSSKNLVYKLDSFSHQEINTDYYRDENKFESDIAKGVDFVYRPDFKFQTIPFESCDLPKCVKSQREKYSHMIKGFS